MSILIKIYARILNIHIEKTISKVVVVENFERKNNKNYTWIGKVVVVVYRYHNTKTILIFAVINIG